MKRPLSIAALVSLALVIIGCSATTYVTSEPEGARITLGNGESDLTPCSFTIPDEWGSGSVYIFKAEKSGYQTKAKIFQESGLDDARAAIPKRIHFVLTRSGKSNVNMARASCDLRVVAVRDGLSVASASGEASLEKLGQLAKALAGKLRREILVKGESIAVVSLRNRSNTDQGRTTAEELADKLSGALIKTGWFNVKERVDLRAVLGERELDTAGIVNNDRARQKFTGIKYVVIGGVTVTHD